MARTTLNNYLLPRQSNSITAKAHHHPAWVAVVRVSRTEIRDHSDGHNCLASVKSARQFATVFANNAVIISQDDKAKIGLGVPAVGRTFHTLQSVNELVSVADHDFPLGNAQKLVPSVYLMIKPNELNDELRTVQLAIFVRRQWSLGTSSLSHMQDLENLTLDPKYNDVLKTNREIRPIWVLLVDGGPDENPRHLKNIKTYCHLFQKFDLDYLTVRTHATGQSKYNPVERESLCDIWRKDLIFGKSVDARYVEELTNPFENIEFEGTDKEKAEEQKQQKKKQEKENDIPECFVPWSWIENHCNLCQYSLDIKRCTNSSCCGPSRAKEATDLLLSNNGFLPPTTKAKDGHFANPIHLLEYYDLLKIPGYDSHCPSIDQTTYSRLCCSVCNKYFPTFNYLTKHKKAMHPVSRGRPKGKSKCNSNSLDDFSLLPSQQKRSLFDEMNLREYISDNE
ncbi:hypothetical protein GLOIN_2v1783204 [Rhizophagus irregularis DAOM 181602=DAOM 197198]|uniref:C2H2-type domain-containing protein n=1 Tax=Rhizophagus irregularis (strain DAOM 197198w) TaxID=1432141 RepID=A0A015K0S4_RHIIW|nr:hypothetical protein RirG_042410 [Rhizophagus irregularis DAOM 197198w]GBC41570.2 hypothetical protein GLOIN_2v1783204 [Rhizophagus irregularis DAOM 181602=DAOM 197198]